MKILSYTNKICLGSIASLWKFKYASCETSHNRIRSNYHRVGLCEWPASQTRFNGDNRTSTIDALFKHVKTSGYDGVEMTIQFFKERYYPNFSLENVAEKVRKSANSYGIQIFGANIWWCFDFPEQNWTAFLREMHEEARLTKKMGGEYLTFQMWISPKYIDTAGTYRNDNAYLKKCAQRIVDLHILTSSFDLNCYIETHVQRISEDPEAFCKIMDLCEIDFEINGDLSHYIFRSFRNDFPEMKRILKRMGHTHQRLCRQFGDLSINIKDLNQDWLNRGATWQAFQFTKPGLIGGLSSRVICGESGPMHEVKDPLTLDAMLVPFYKFLCKYADSSVKNEPINVNNPSDILF